MRIDVRDYSGNTPLHISSLKGFTNISQLLIDSGCEISARNKRDETPLHSAVHSNSLAHVELLLKNNANVDVRDNFENTPLHISSLKGFTNISQLLIDSGSMVNKRNHWDETPLHSAVRGNNLAHVELLLKNNANRDVQDRWGNTPLHISTRQGFFNISQLIDPGCNKNLKNKAGRTPLNVEPSFLLLGSLEEPPGLDEPPLRSAIVGKRRSGLLLEKQRQLSSSEEYEPGATRKHPIDTRGLSRRVSSGKDDPRMKQPTSSTHPSPMPGKLKEQSSAEGSGTLLKDLQELSSSEESKLLIGKKKGRTPGVERRRTHPSRCEVM